MGSISISRFVEEAREVNRPRVGGLLPLESIAWENLRLRKEGFALIACSFASEYIGELVELLRDK